MPRDPYATKQPRTAALKAAGVNEVDKKGKRAFEIMCKNCKRPIDKQEEIDRCVVTVQLHFSSVGL